jgi:hypothetical protein
MTRADDTKDRGPTDKDPEQIEAEIERTRSQISERFEESADRARERVRRLGDRATELGHRAKDRAIRVESGALEFARENPLAVGAAVLAVGVGIGLLLPPTRREDEFLGEARDRLVDDVRGSVEGMGRAAKESAREVQDALREERTL